MHVFVQVVISMVGIYIIFSIINSALVEGYAQYFNKRGKFLKTSLDNFFQDPVDASINLADDMYEHPMVKAFMKDKKHLPNYIDKKIFSQVLMDLVFTKSDNHEENFTAELAESHSNKIPDGLKSTLHFIIKKTKVDDKINMDGIQKEIETLYESYMTRVTGWYKQKTKIFLGIAGSALALLLNLDTVNFYQALTADGDLRREQVDISKKLDANRTAIEEKAQTLKDKIKTTNLNTAELKNNVDGLLSEILDKEDADTFKANMGKLHIGINQIHKDKNSPLDWVIGFLGIALTGIALSFGSSFWFEVLRKILRGG